MVSIVSTSLDSRLSTRPYKPLRLKADLNPPTHMIHYNSSQPRDTNSTLSMSLTNGEFDGPHGRKHSSSEEEETADSIKSISTTPPTPSTIRNASRPRPEEHVVTLSSLEHCMPRAYIRICLAYRVPTEEAEAQALAKLKFFVRRIVDAKPYLAGWVVPAQDHGPQEGKMEVRFTLDDLDNFPTLQIRRLTHEEVPYTYDQLDKAGLPPSVLRPDLVSALPESADENRAPVFRVQANLVDGGLIVSFYLHHCISDGTGMGLLISGAILDDDCTFQRNLAPGSFTAPELSSRLSAFAKRKTCLRSALSWSDPNRVSDRQIQYRSTTQVEQKVFRNTPPGRGCIFAFSDETLSTIKESFIAEMAKSPLPLHVTTTDVIQTLLWHYMTSARVPSLLPENAVTHSKLLTPVNLRNRLKDNDKDTVIDDNYFGAAVDFASAQLSLEHLQRKDPAALTITALAIHEAISKVDATYVRAAIALSNSTDPTVDVRDLQASNMNRTTGADMYITSWERMDLYSSELDLDLGKPDWVRKPWSKDPGSCIILPRNPKKPVVEVVIQMTEDDMARLLADKNFMAMVSRVIE